MDAVEEGTTHYGVLGVHPRDDNHTIRRAYVSLARVWHPDYHIDDDSAALAEAKDRIREVNEAWRVLGHQQRRADYDRRLAREGGQGFRPDGTGRWEPFEDTDGPDPRDLLDDRPIGDGGRLGRFLTIAPVAGLGAAVGLLGFGLVVDSSEILTAAVIAFAVTLLLFLAVPLVALARSARTRPLSATDSLRRWRRPTSIGSSSLTGLPPKRITGTSMNSSLGLRRRRPPAGSRPR